MSKTPKIILTSKFTFSSTKEVADYGSYATSYMGRKEALESKSYLTPEEETELIQKQATERENRRSNLVTISEYSASNPGTSALAKANYTELNHHDAINLSNEDYGKYIGYMMRREALADKKQKEGLSPKEEAELKRVNDGAKKYELPSLKKDKILPGYFSKDQATIRLKDLDKIRNKMRSAQENSSILWQDVISFDNDYLRQLNVFDPTTGYLDEDGIRKASAAMMKVLEVDEGLNNPFWTASIHRNTDNIHIHFGIVEAANSRPLKKVVNRNKVHLEPKGRRKLSTIEHMKHTFANSMFDTTELLKDMNLKRNEITKAIATQYHAADNNLSFQKSLNEFVRTLPDDKNKWRWANLNTIQRKRLTDLVDLTMQDNPSYQSWNLQFKKYQKHYDELYGHSKNADKNSAAKKWEDMKRRSGNALLKQIKEQAKEVERVHAVNRNKVQEKVLNASRRPNRELDRKLKQTIKPIFSKKSSNKAYNDIKTNMQKNLTTFEKARDLAEYNEMQHKIEIEQQQR